VINLLIDANVGFFQINLLYHMVEIPQMFTKYKHHDALNKITFTDVYRIHTMGMQQRSIVSFIKINRRGLGNIYGLSIVCIRL
jgi:hypothetical protein